MKIFLNIIAYLIIVTVLYFALYNIGETVTFHILIQQCADKLNSLNIGTFHEMTASVNFSVLSIGLFAAGFLSAMIIFGQMYKTAGDKLKAYKRELEKNSVEKDSSTSRVDVLEAKIKVLEKALQDALNK